MPPRKSNLSQTATTGDEGTPSKNKERDGVNIEDLALPRTMVQRLAKGVIPANTQIQKDAITAMSKSATLFVNYLAHAANTSPAMGTRKTISPEAVLDALAELEFENFLPRVQAELQRFNEVQTGKRNEYRRKLKEKEENGTVGVSRGVTAMENGEGEDDGDERAAKRVRRDDDGLATDAPSIPRKRADFVENGDDVEEEEQEEEEEEEEDDEEEVEEARERDDQLEDEIEKSNSPGDDNGEDEATEEDEDEEGSSDEEVEESLEVEDDEDHDTSLVDRGREAEEEDSSEDSG